MKSVGAKTHLVHYPGAAFSTLSNHFRCSSARRLVYFLYFSRAAFLAYERYIEVTRRCLRTLCLAYFPVCWKTRKIISHSTSRPLSLFSLMTRSRLSFRFTLQSVFWDTRQKSLEITVCARNGKSILKTQWSVLEYMQILCDENFPLPIFNLYFLCMTYIEIIYLLLLNESTFFSDFSTNSKIFNIYVSSTHNTHTYIN